MYDHRAQAGLAALQAGDKREARRIFADLVRELPQDESSWWLLAQATDDSEQKAVYLRQALRLNPGYQEAARQLAAVERRIAKSTPARGSHKPTIDVDELGQGSGTALGTASGNATAKWRNPLRGLWFALAGAGVLTVIIAVLAMIPTGPLASPLAPTIVTGTSVLQLTVTGCTTADSAEASLLFINESNATVIFEQGAEGSATVMMSLSAGAQKLVQIVPNERSRFSAYIEGNPAVSGAAVIEVPAGSICQVRVSR